MKKFGNITIKGPQGQIKTFGIFKGKVVNLKCRCTGNTTATATQFMYDFEHDEAYCPRCNKRPEMVETLTQYNQRIDKLKIQEQDTQPLKLVLSTWDWETGIKYYALNKRIPHEEWEKVKDLFYYYTSDMFEDYEGASQGWMTRQPEKVEEILGITETLDKQEKESQKRKERREQIRQRQNELRRKIESGEYMQKTSLYSLLDSADDSFEDYFYSWKDNDIYGGGRMYILTPDDAVVVTNNGHDGDNWNMNNIETGGAGAIGYKITRTPDVDELFHACKKLIQ